MLLDLSEIVMRTGMHAEVDLDQPGVEDPELVFAAPLKGHFAFDNGGDLVSIHGQAQTALQIPCARCLTDVEVPMEIPVEEHFPVADILNPTKPPEEGAEFDTVVSTVVYLDQGKPILDMDELLRQLIITEVPIRTVCSEDCAGLCPQCGANRNETPCTCGDQPQNTPLASLGVLLQNGSGSAPDSE